MSTFVEVLQRHNVQCANPILESTPHHSTLLLGDFYSALDKKWQQLQGIAAVLTVAQGLNIEPHPLAAHKVIDALDLPDFNLAQHFKECYDFIDYWLKKGPVLVHCAAGISRSAAIVVYYLMRSKKWSFAKAMQYVKAKRKVVHPNEGFIRQLKAEEKQLGVVVFKESTIEKEQQKADKIQLQPIKGTIRGRSVIIKTSTQRRLLKGMQF